MNTPAIIDKFISAEIPNIEQNLRLHEIVMRNMIHGPCADWCMIDGKCSKRFPKHFQDETSMDENGYPNYRRINDGTTYELQNGHTVDNRWVVPYCSILLENFNCHINLEEQAPISKIFV